MKSSWRFYHLVPNYALPGAAFAEILAQVATLAGCMLVIFSAIKYAFPKEQVASHEE